MKTFRRRYFASTLFYLALMAAAVWGYAKTPPDSVVLVILAAAALLVVFFWGVTMLILASQVRHTVSPDPPGRWITNVDQGHIHPDGHGADCGPGAAGAICVTCNKKMPGIWDTVCASCGATSCYNHSTVVNGHWHCNKCMLFTLGQDPRTIDS